jgi:ribonuclease BN (tRNA processing enzyme)
MKVQRIMILCILAALVAVGVAAATELGTNVGGDERTVDQDTTGKGYSRVVTIEKPTATVLPVGGSGNYNTRLVLLGTTGGVAWWPGTERASSSSVLVVGETLYIIDLGQGSAWRLSEAFNPETPNTGKKVQSPSTFLEDARALFFTHLHQDHVADYPALLLIGPGSGLGTKTDASGKTIVVPMIVIGPADRGALEIDKSNYTDRHGTILYTDSANPANITPTPGTRQMTNLIWQAYAQTINDMTLDNAYRDFTKLVEIREIGGPLAGDIEFPVPDTLDLPNSTCPAMDPFEVYRDENVCVTAVLVDHHQVYPSFAYRFTTKDGSVVFSGDTGPDTSGNLENLSAGADVLVHEVIDQDWIDERMGFPNESSPAFALKTHLMTALTTIDVVGSVATNCSVNTLVLNHFVPGTMETSKLLRVKRNFTGQLILGEDLMQIGIGKASSRYPRFR